MKPDIQVHVAARDGKPQRLVVVSVDDTEHRDNINTDSATSRRRFVGDFAKKLRAEPASLGHLESQIVAASDAADERADMEAAGGDARGDDRKASQATKLVELASQAELWHTPDGTSYATIRLIPGQATAQRALTEAELKVFSQGAATVPAGHLEHWPVKSKSFRRWLQRLYYLEGGAAPNAQAIQDAIGVLEGKAVFDGPEHTVSVRVAEHDGSVYLDLCNDDWQAIEISNLGWRVVDEPPVKFRRTKAMLPFTMPKPGGHVADLRRFINVADADWPLILGWLIAALFPRGPFPLLCFSAEQGSGKSTASRVLRAFVDPNSAPLRCEPREPRDLMIAANNGWLVALDNLSHLPAWLSDALCRLSTGGGFSTRTLYENDEETIFDAMRPAILNGIEDVATRGDLLDRAIVVNLPTIPEHNRRAESEFWTDFEDARPAIFGALLVALAGALRDLPTVKLTTLPRMADFAKLATAAESGLGLPPMAFLEAYTGNINDANSLALEASTVSRYIIELAATTWQGTASELLTELNARASEATRKQKAWPKSARVVAGLINRLAPNLRRAGVAVDQWRQPDKGRRRVIALEQVGISSSASSASSETLENTVDRRTQADDGGRNTTPCRTQDGRTADASDDADARFPLCSDGEVNASLAEAADEDSGDVASWEDCEESPQ
jgi:hypothetical protein